ncbi:MAG TPA: DUF4350 domain-containing protein [Candidatus Thermoplasmatota archaeon]|nr:DUF4350 domain-containing protein [Candidatus Thermoplasmatota archaeon]
MKRFLWLGILFLSASWLFLIPQFTIPDLFIGLLCVILGILCMIGGVWCSAPKHLDIRYLVLLIPLACALIFVAFPYNLGLVVLILGLLVSLLFSTRKTAQAIPLGMTLAGIILLVQTMVFPFYMSFVSHGHRIDMLSPLVSFVANFLGLHTSTNNGILFIQTIQQTYPITLTWEKLGCYLSLNMFLGALLLFVLFYEKRKILKNTIIFLLTSALYIITRFVAILILYVTTTELSVFWDPVAMTLSFLPFSFLLMKLLPLKDSNETFIHVPSLRLTKKHLIAMLMMFLLVFSFLGTFLFQDPGSIKNGRVLIDEYHSQWEDSIRPLDTEWYGLLSTYNYYSWAQWLGYHYHVVKNMNTTLTTEILNKYDILILKCPTESYTTQEIQSIKHFVENGGGLYLIGDHTNVFGMNTFLNQISEEFGIRYKTDATYELGTGDLSTYRSDPLFSHPVMRHVTQFDFMTSCTLEPTSFLASARIENIIIGNRVISEPGTYATENFFRESIASPDSEYGYLLQAAAIKYGQGRVVAFTDSTVFSSFSMFTDGYPSFTLGVMEYLNRANCYAYLNMVLLGICIALLVVLLILLRSIKKIKTLWMLLFAGLLAFSTVTPLCSYMTNVSYPLPPAQTDYTQVCFEQQHSSVNISVKPTASFGNNKNNFGTFFVWTQRIGCVPSLEKTLKDAVGHGDIIVIVNPVQPFTETEIHLLTTYFEKGGRVLLMDSITNTKSTANELIGNFGIWITTNIDDQYLYFNRSENSSQMSVGNMTIPYITITGGNQILTNNKNEIYASMTEFMNKTTGDVGKLVVVVDSYAFSDAVMGGTFTEPTEQQHQIFTTEFFLFNEVLST